MPLTDAGSDAAVDAAADSVIDAGSGADARCGFDQSYELEWVGSLLAAPSQASLRPASDFTLRMLAADGGVLQTCTKTLPCGGPGVDTQDVAELLTSPRVVASFSQDGGVIGTVNYYSSDERERVIRRGDGQRILLGRCSSTACTEIPAELRALTSALEALQSQHGISLRSCADWRR